MCCSRPRCPAATRNTPKTISPRVSCALPISLPSGYLYNTENYQSYVDELRNFCAAHDGLEYWDFSLYKLQSEINLKIEDFSDAHHLNGAGAEKFTAILCKTIRRRAAGESVDDLFYQTVEEKLTLTPDDSVLMAYYAKLQDE